MTSPSPVATVHREIHDALTCWRIVTAQGEALVAEQGAQVLRYGRPGDEPLIWLSEQATFVPGQSVRGGIPVCWPWFGELARNPHEVRDLHPTPEQAPFHGLVRTLPWTLQQIATEGHEVTLSFELTAPAQPPAGWPEGLDVRLDIRVGEQLELILISHNRGQRAVHFSQALHSYFAVSDIAQVSVPALDGCRYVDSLQDWATLRQQGPVQFTGETDRLYLDVPSRVDIEDAGWQRRICLETTGSRSAIVWNPWIDKAQRLSAFADDAWQRMLCIETANVLEDVVTLAPGSRARLGLRLSSTSLAG